MEDFWSLSGAEFVEWLREHKAEIEKICAPKNLGTFEFYWQCLLQDAAEAKQISRVISHDSEFGFANHIVISPLEMVKRCKRYDDLIDWLEEDGLPRWKWLDKGIYPYQNGEMPVSVVAVCLYLGLQSLIPDLKEALYVYWS